MSESKSDEAQVNDFISNMKVALGCKRISKEYKDQVIRDRNEIKARIHRKLLLRSRSLNRKVTPASRTTYCTGENDTSSLIILSN